MLINDEWRKCNPINDILQPHENLPWIGRPNKEIYVRGNRTRRGLITIGRWSLVILVVSVIGLIFGISGNRTFNGNQVFVGVVMLGALFLFNYAAFAPRNYKRAEWYAFSEQRIFLAAWDDEKSDFAISQTGLSNLSHIAVRKSKKVPKEAANVGNLVCTYRQSIQRHFRNQLTFEVIDNPVQVQTLLLSAKAGSTV